MSSPDDELAAAKQAAIELGRALNDYEEAVRVYGMAESDEERAELRPLMEKLRARVTEADSRSTLAIAALKKIEDGVN